ncbi:MAG: hypothetical protein Q9165_004833 [Trypethelium subeluteriae]
MSPSHYLPPSSVFERADSQSTCSHDTPSYTEKNQHSVNEQAESSNRLHPVWSLQQEVKELREDINNTIGPGEALRRAVTGQSTASVKDPGPPPDGGVLAWTQAIMAHLVIFNTWGYIASFGVFQTYYTTTLGHPASDISWVGSVQIFLLFFIGTFSGRAIDGGLFHHVFIAGFIIQLFGVFMTSLSTKYWQLFLAQGVCTGIANGLQFCPTMSLVSTYFSKKRAFAMGVAATGSATGGLVFPAIVRSLLPQIGFAWTVRVLGFVMLGLGALYTSTLRTRLPPRKSGPLVEWSAFREPTYVLSVFGIFLAFWSLYFAFYYVGAYGRNIIGIPYEESISLLLIMNGVGIPARLIPNYFADRTFGPLNMVIPYCFLTGCVFYAWSGVHNRGGVYAFALLNVFWINTTDGRPQNPTNVSRGIYGATVGIDRLLKLWEKYNIKATWFTPAHTLDSFPKQIAKIRDAGHEIGLHGYTHEYVSRLSVTQQLDVLTRSIDTLTTFTGQKPLGFTAPAWSTSPELIPMLEDFGIVYDHSFMHHDVQPYWAPTGNSWTETNYAQDAKSWMAPMTALRPSNVVEIPANWHLDDWPPLQPNMGTPGSHGFVDPHLVERLWLEQFDYAYREHETFIFPMSIHPQVSGKPHVILMHERIIEYINKHEGIEWMTFGEMAKEFKGGALQGAKVET